MSVARSDPQTTPEPSVIQSFPLLSEVTSEATRAALERRVEDFIRAITRNSKSPDGYSLVRWNTPICLLVAGLSAEEVKIVSDRLSLVSTFAGAPLARAPCQPNFVVVTTADPDQILNAWYARNKRLFGDAPPAQIQEFIDSSRSRPVRVWYNINRGRKAGMRNGHFVPSATQADSSVFLGNAVFDFSSVFAIIDTRRTEHTTLDQLADYAAMIGLTDIDLDADLASAPSILQLFAPSAKLQPSGLSSWDAAFLRALYRSNQASRTQRLDISQRVTEDILR